MYITPITTPNDTGNFVFGNIDESNCILHENVPLPTYSDFKCGYLLQYCLINSLFKYLSNTGYLFDLEPPSGDNLSATLCKLLHEHAEAIKNLNKAYLCYHLIITPKISP